MSIETGRQNFDIFKRTAKYEFAKTRHDYETGDQRTVERAVAQVAQRLEVSPAIAKQILDEDGWRSRFEPQRPKQERDLMAQSGGPTSATQGAAVGEDGTAAKLGGFRDWKP